MASFLSGFFGGKNDEARLRGIVARINAEEPSLQNLSLDDLKKESLTLSDTIKNKGDTREALDSALPRAFALARESARRTLNQRPYDVQCMGGIVLHEGAIAEMATGEGKTLAATLPAYLNALTGKGVHVVTVNDYLARRDAVWMGQIYEALGMSVACIVHGTAFRYDPQYANTTLDAERDTTGVFHIVQDFLRPISRKEAYACDITYGTNHEFGFDYLRDNLVTRIHDRVQRPHAYAIVDEIDSILIDEARTPLIIAAPDEESSELYKTFTRIAERLKKEEDYLVDEKLRTVTITEQGITQVEKMMGIDNLFAPGYSRLVHFLNESLKAHALFKRDIQYVVKNGEVIIVDEFTGRMLQGRRYSGGLHQAIEAKEGVTVQKENRTYAQITIQNYFRLYEKIAGMTGTAQTSAEEFHKVYNLNVVSIPTHRPNARKDLSDLIYKNKDQKYKAIVKDVEERRAQGQPILLGTTSISNNETLSEYLTRANIPHEVLNAKNNEREGAIIAQAGKPGAVTVATNMAGRGVDIILGGNPPVPEDTEKVKRAGGLHVMGTERHEARRIDNQLRGRAGRQGDPGSSQFFLSLEDELVRVFGGDRIKKLMETMHFPDDTPIESGFVSKAINQAQGRVEGNNFDARKHLLDFDDVLNKQRTAIYRKRNEFLECAERNEILPTVREILSHYLGIIEAQPKESEGLPQEQKEQAEKVIETLRTKIETLPETIEPERASMIGEHLVRLLDTVWVEHLEHLEGLRDSVNIRAYAQHEPIVEYRREAYALFNRLNSTFEAFVVSTIFPIFEANLNGVQNQQNNSNPVAVVDNTKNIGRNDPCWCGAKKSDGTPVKFKHCHGK